MTSSDHELLISINNRLSRLEDTQAIILQRQEDFDRQLFTLQQEQQYIRRDIAALGTRIEDLKSYSNIWFTVIAVVIGVVGALSSVSRKSDNPAIITMPQPDLNDIARRAVQIMKEEKA